jgi:ubiquinone/menaquinone biosynthesis C-methylase UbiE
LIGNAFNRLRYTLWSPGYDLVGRGFDRLRRRSLALLDLAPGERVLLIGAGTGVDLAYLPDGTEALVTDLTPAMLARARARARPGVAFAVMDGQALDLPDASFDAVILHLILAVIPDPVRCLREAARVLKPGGRIAVMDKFLADGTRASLIRRVANVVTGLLATQINRRLGDILGGAGTTLRVVRDEPAALGSFFRIVQLRKPA